MLETMVTVLSRGPDANWKYFEIPPPPARMAIMGANDRSCWRGEERGVAAPGGTPAGWTLEVRGEVSQKLELDLACEPAMLFLSLYPKDCELMWRREIHTSVLMRLYSR